MSAIVNVSKELFVTHPVTGDDTIATLVIDDVQGAFVATDGNALTMLNDGRKGIISVQQAWQAIPLKMLAAAVKASVARYRIGIPTRVRTANAMDGRLLQLTPEDALAFGVDLVSIPRYGADRKTIIGNVEGAIAISLAALIALDELLTGKKTSTEQLSDKPVDARERAPLGMGDFASSLVAAKSGTIFVDDLAQPHLKVMSFPRTERERAGVVLAGANRASEFAGGMVGSVAPANGNGGYRRQRP